MNKHVCHAIACGAACPPKHLMCLSCWSKVPRDIQMEVNRTVKLRGPSIDASWAPWWRVTHRAIYHVATLNMEIKILPVYLERAMAFADRLEARDVTPTSKII